MQNELRKKYGLFTAISMVVGIVIGSGVFFKAEKVLIETNGNIPLGIIAWGLVGMIMIICSFAFATMATRHEKINGVVDYADVYVNRKYGYFMGWFMAVIYKPTLTSVLAWVSARYTCVLLNWDITGGSCMVIAGFYLIAIFALNSLSPILSGRFQVTTTIIKLIPLILMAVAGTIVGLQNGMTMENFNRTAVETVNTGGGLFAAVVAVAFAYEGWIIATSINSEIRDSKKNLPLALMIGAFIVVIVYILYYIGLAGAVPAAELMANGQAGAKLAFQNIFGQVAGTLIFVFIIISCLGTLNGLMVGCTRALYSLAVRGYGPNPNLLKQVDPVTNMPPNSSILGLLLSAFWLLYFYGANLTASWFGPVVFDTSELPIITLYAGYIPILLMMMKRETTLSTFKRLVMPGLAILSCIFMVVAAVIAHEMAAVYYLLVFAVIMLAGIPFMPKKIR